MTDGIDQSDLNHSVDFYIIDLRQQYLQDELQVLLDKHDNHLRKESDNGLR